MKLKPGKPLAFGEVKGVPFVGLPGNPVSGFVVLLMMARPFLLRRMGLKEVDLTPMKIRADFDWLKAGDREEFVRVRRNAEGGLDIYHTQNSQVLSSCAWQMAWSTFRRERSSIAEMWCTITPLRSSLLKIAGRPCHPYKKENS